MPLRGQETGVRRQGAAVAPVERENGVFSWLFSWWQRCREPPLHHLRFVLYTRQGCHLCEVAERVLQRAQRRQGFVLETVDIDGDLQLVALHGEQVPVVAVNGKVRFRGQI